MRRLRLSVVMTLHYRRIAERPLGNLWQQWRLYWKLAKDL